MNVLLMAGQKRALPAGHVCARVSVPRTGKRMPKRSKARPKNETASRERVRVLITGGRLQKRKPKHLRVAVLLDKPERRIAAVHADYIGFSIPNEFVVGYGLDYAERYRNLPYVGVLLLGPGLKKKPAEA